MITFLILKYDIIENSRIELRVLPVQMGGLLGGGGGGGAKGMLPPHLSNYWGGCPPHHPPPPTPPLPTPMHFTSKNIIGAYTDRGASRDEYSNITTNGGLILIRILIRYVFFFYYYLLIAYVTIQILIIRYVHK